MRLVTFGLSDRMAVAPVEVAHAWPFVLGAAALASLYALAGAAFVGGTLDPAVGGHNPLEVIAHGVPLVIGPHARNFADLVADLRQAEGLAVAADPAGIERHLAGLAAGGAEARGMVARAAGVVAQHQGALARTLSLLRPFLETAGGGPRPER
ncbi:MAG: hypothetical protein GX442_24950 [Candidatus Riflebacteria bacterium]|nr:hypothetical protein [Candidatus Riflebacteria bacterium]